ncbi:MAG: aldo/keto reductase [Chthonomonadales bacterium]|nr:aldo/keto reductase [Chthonomonadales bacterium]
MRTIPLHATDLHVSEVCLGAGAFGTGLIGTALDAVVDAFLGAGGTFFDTAHCYAFWLPEGLGASERALGDALRRLGAADHVVVATKGGHPDGGPDYRRPDAYLAEEVVASDVDESRERLGVETIALYFLHRDDPRVPVGEIVEMLNRQAARGAVRWLGASNWSTARLAEANAYAAAHGLRGFAASQVQWSLARPTWEPGPDPTTRYVTGADAAWYAQAGMPVVAYSATASGFFCDAPSADAHHGTPENRARRERARSLAARLGCSPTAVALAWLRCQAPTVIPLFSTSRPEHVAEAAAATGLALSAEEARWLRDG